MVGRKYAKEGVYGNFRVLRPASGSAHRATRIWQGSYALIRAPTQSWELRMPVSLQGI